MRTLQQVFRRRSSLGSSSNNSGATPHLLASLPSNDSAIDGLGLPPPAPPAAATSPRGALSQGGGRTPPRPSPDSTIATRKSYGTDTTQVATNVTTSAHCASDYKDATRAVAATLRYAKDDGCRSTLSNEDDDEESDTISDLTALSAAYNSGAQTEVDGTTDQESGTEMTKEKTAKSKPKSIFRRKLRYTKPQLSFGRSSGSSRTPKAKGGGIPPMSPPRKFRADMSALLLHAPKGDQTSHQHPQQVASPKTPKTATTEEVSLDYSTDEAETTPVSRNGNKATTNGDNSGDEWNKVEVHTPPHQTHNFLHSLEHMSTPSAPTRPSRSDSSASTSLSSSCYSGDTFSTLTTKSSTNPSVKSAPAMACVDNNESMNVQQAIYHHHRRVKSQEQMDELFATILNITDAPGRGIEDMLMANKTIQSQAKASRSSRPRRKRQVSSINAIANIGFVEDEERARARESGARGVLAPRFESYGAGAEMKGEYPDPRTTLHPPQLPRIPMEPGDHWRHRRRPSREEQMLAAPRMPLFPRNEPKALVSRNKSIDSIEQGRQSPHVQFREERLCSFYSSCGNINDVGREESLELFGEDEVTAGKPKEMDYEREEERLDSEIYQTVLSMEQAFDVKVEDIDDLSTGRRKLSR